MEYRKLIEIEFLEFDEKGLEKSWEWLNDPEIKHLTGGSDFDRESQKEWYNSLSSRNDYYITSVATKDQLVGICGLKKITDSDAEMWGYIGVKDLWGKTIGPQMIDHLVQYGRDKKLESLYFICLKENRILIKTASRFGFVNEGEVDELNVMMRKVL